MGQADDIQGSFPGGFALEVNRAVFGDQKVGIHSGSGDHRAGLKPGDHPGNLAIVGRSIKGNDGFAAPRIEGPPDIIQLSAGAAEFEAAQIFGIALAQNIHLNGGVNGDHMVVLGNDSAGRWCRRPGNWPYWGCHS